MPTPNPAEQAELFRKLADGYDEAIRRYQPTYDAMLRLSTDLACVAAPGRARCLDFGTGTGSALPLLCPLFEEVVAIEPGKAMLDLARRRAKAECNLPNAGRLVFVEGSHTTQQAAAFADDSFDAVHCSLVMMFIREETEKLQILKFFHRILRPGGALVLTELVTSASETDEQSTFALWRALMRHRGAAEEFVDSAERQVHVAMRRQTPEQLASLLVESGFGRVERPYQALHTLMFLAVK
jgi:tRNA (cmo5U34)-methyltransferase